MIKKLLLAIAIITSTSQAHVAKFEHEEILSRLYLEVEPNIPRICMQQVVIDYMAWCDQNFPHVATKQDALYVTRVSYLFGEVMLSYQYGI